MHLTESQVMFSRLRVEKQLEAGDLVSTALIQTMPQVEVDEAMEELEDKGYVRPCDIHRGCLVVSERSR